jgi:hypothetical protein
VIKGQGARAEIRRKTTVEATEGCNINQASVQADQVHKIREQILSTCVTTVEVFKNLRRFLQEACSIKILENLRRFLQEACSIKILE